jgi:hypothetical protein
MEGVAPRPKVGVLLSKQPNATIPESNWLPASEGKVFSLNFRAYVPKDAVKRGEWFPPAIQQAN